MRWIVAICALLAAGLCGLMWSAARSDFRFRGCPDLPRAEWEATANCADGWFGMVLFGGGAIALSGLAAWAVWRGYA